MSSTVKKATPVVGNDEAKPKLDGDKFLTILETALFDRRSLMNKLIDPRRDYDLECGYPTTIEAAMYRATYDRQGLGSRIVRALPSESWSQDPQVYETEDPEETPFESAFATLEKDKNLWHHLHRIDEVSGIGRFGILLLGFSGGDGLETPLPGVSDKPLKFGEVADTAAPEKKAAPSQNALPLPEDKGVSKKPTRELLFVRCFDESVVDVATRESNMGSPRYGQPLTYNVKMGTDEPMAAADLATSAAKVVHWTRVIHVADNRQLSEVYGTPRMQEVFNRILDAKKVLSGAGEMFWKGAFPGHSFEVQPGVTEADLDIDALKDQFTAYQDGLQRFLALVGVSVKSLAPQIADPTAHYEAILNEIAIAMGIPKRILQGSERGELASSQDAKAWNTRLARRNDKYVSPLIIRVFVDRMIAAGVLPMPKEYTVHWPDLNSASDEEKAKIALTKTQAITTYISGHGDQIIPPAEFLTHVMGFDQETVDAIMAANEEYQATVDGPLDPALGLEAEAQAHAQESAGLDREDARAAAKDKNKLLALKQKQGRGNPSLNEQTEEEKALEAALVRIATLEKTPKLEFHLKDERVTNMPAITNVIEAQQAPVVKNEISLPPTNVENKVTVMPAAAAAPVVIPAPVVHSNPNVNVAAPNVTVSPEINVKPADVVVMPQPPAPPREFKVKRDPKDGKIIGGSST